MKQRSKRDLLVKKLVLISITIASIFGINIFYFYYSQNKLKSSIKKIEAFSALESSLATDKINLIFNLEKEKFNCSKKFPNQCIEYFTALIMTRNRIKDYSGTINETLKVPKDNFLFEEFNKLIGLSNLVAKKSFGLSFEEAKNLGIVTPKEYISNIKKNQISQASFKSTSEIFLKSITKLYNQS